MIFWDGVHLHCFHLPKFSTELFAVIIYTSIFVCTVTQFLACLALPIQVTLTPSSNGAANTTFTFPKWFNHTDGLNSTTGLNGTNATAMTTGAKDANVIQLDIIRRRMKMTVDSSTSYWDYAPWPYVNTTFLDGLHISNKTQTEFMDQLEAHQKGSFAQLRSATLGFPIALSAGMFTLFIFYTVLHQWLKEGGITSNTMDIPWFGKCHKVYIFIFAFGFAIISTLIGLGITFGLALSRSLAALNTTFSLLEPQIERVDVSYWNPFINAYVFSMPFAFMAMCIAAYLTWRYDAVFHSSPYGVSKDYPQSQEYLIKQGMAASQTSLAPSMAPRRMSTSTFRRSLAGPRPDIERPEMTMLGTAPILSAPTARRYSLAATQPIVPSQSEISTIPQAPGLTYARPEMPALSGAGLPLTRTMSMPPGALGIGAPRMTRTYSMPDIAAPELPDADTLDLEQALSEAQGQEQEQPIPNFSRVSSDIDRYSLRSRSSDINITIDLRNNPVPSRSNTSSSTKSARSAKSASTARGDNSRAEAAVNDVGPAVPKKGANNPFVDDGQESEDEWEKDAAPEAGTPKGAPRAI